MAAVWLDVTRCTGCGACVEVCPTSALTLVDGKAYLEDALCQGCEACIQACPAGALQPVLEIEAVPTATHVPEYAPTSVPTSVSISSRTSLLATVVAAGAQLAIQAAPLVLNTLGQLLLRPRGSKVVQSAISAIAGRQARHRRRGR